jgi:hypothetical protein
MSTLQAVVELVDKMSGPLATLTKNVADFAKGVADGAKEELALIKNGNDAAKAQDTLKTSLMDVGKALLGLKVAKDIFDGFAASMKAADNLDDMAGKTGIAADKLKDYSVAAKLSDTSLETMVQGLNKLNRSMVMSQEESAKQAEAFSLLGVKTKNADGTLKSSEQTFLALADAFSGLKDGPEKAALAFAVFGTAGKELLPMMKDGAAGIQALRDESALLGQMGPDAFNAYAKSSGDMFDGLTKVQTIFEGLYNTISAEIVPVFNVLIQSFVESFKSGGMVAQILDAIKVVAIGALVPAMKTVILVFRGFADVLEIAGKSLGALGAIIAAVASGDITGAKAIWNAYKEDVAKTAQEHVNFSDKLFDASNATDVSANALDKLTKKHQTAAPILKKAAGAVAEIKSELVSFVDSLNTANAAMGLDDSVKQRMEAMSKYAKDIKKGVDPTVAADLLAQAMALITNTKEKKENADATELFKKAQTMVGDEQLKVSILETEARLIGASKTERDAAVQTLMDEADIRKITNGLTGDSKTKIEAEIKALQDRRNAAKGTIGEGDKLKGLLAGTTVEQVKAAQDDIALIEKAYADGRIKTQDEYVQAIQLRLAQIKDTTKATTDDVTIFWQEAAKGMQNSMSSFFFDAMQGKMSDLGSSFKTLLDRMVADALAANLGNALLGNSFTKTGSLGGWAKTGLDWFSGLFSGARATGGSVEAGKMYMVGEKGPEPFIPKTSGMILPNSSIRQAGTGGAQVNISITAMDSQDVRRALEKDSRWLADMVNKSTRAYNLGI